jgi:hypothetical protein
MLNEFKTFPLRNPYFKKNKKNLFIQKLLR